MVRVAARGGRHRSFILRSVKERAHGSAEVEDVPRSYPVPSGAVEGVQRRARAGDRPGPDRCGAAPSGQGLPAWSDPDRRLTPRAGPALAPQLSSTEPRPGVGALLSARGITPGAA